MRRMILPERVFGRLGAHCSRSGAAIALISLRTHCTSSARSASFGCSSARKVIGVDPLPLDVVRIANDRSLGDLWMRDERALDLGGAEAVAGDIDDIVDPAGDPVEPVSVAARAVTGDVKG